MITSIGLILARKGAKGHNEKRPYFSWSRVPEARYGIGCGGGHEADELVRVRAMMRSTSG